LPFHSDRCCWGPITIFVVYRHDEARLAGEIEQAQSGVIRPRLAVPLRFALGKRIRGLADGLAVKLGGWSALSMVQASAVRRAAEMAILAQDARQRRLRGDETISLEDLVRLDAAADRALRRLGLGKPGVQAKKSAVELFEEHMAALTPNGGDAA
jgi:hypothetical protein